MRKREKQRERERKKRDENETEKETEREKKLRKAPSKTHHNKIKRAGRFGIAMVNDLAGKEMGALDFPLGGFQASLRSIFNSWMAIYKTLAESKDATPDLEEIGCGLESLPFSKLKTGGLPLPEFHASRGILGSIDSGWEILGIDIH
ncbi:Tma22, partial [Ophiophagus hannah]